MLFGNDSAEHDDLLYECSVDISSTYEYSQVFIGRWGTGKSASMFLRNKELRNYICKIDNHKEDIWYINEKSINSILLQDLRAKCKTSKDFIFKAEKLWRAEIIRTAILVLGILRNHYNYQPGEHWDFISNAYLGGKLTGSLWSNHSALVTTILFSDETMINEVAELKGDIEDVFSDKVCHYVQHCLEDIKSQNPQIVIGVEPIETPKSPLENAGEGIAQDVIAALMNSFVSYFQPSKKQLLKVYIALPWHRNKIDGIINPQKLEEYECKLEWEKEELKAFINARIDWEFKRVKRNVKGSDPWYELFEDNLRNEHCSNKIFEDSFDYILRHTSHRPREMQKLARKAVETYARKINRTIDDIIAGRSGVKIPGSVLRNMIRDYCAEAYEHYLEEIRRRFPEVTEYLYIINGIVVPFDIKEIRDRIRKMQVSFNITDMIKKLWDVGIIGIEISFIDHKADDDMYEKYKSIFDDKCHVLHEDLTIKKKFHRWYKYYYNSKIDPLKLNERFENDPEIQIKFVLHPRTFEVLPSKLSRQWPIGV